MSITQKTKKIKISELKIGDHIKSHCPQSGDIIYKEVLDVWDTIVPSSDQWHLAFANGTTLNCSCNHPIMVLRERGLVEVKPHALQCNDLVITDSGDCTTLISASNQCNNPTGYIDITVAETNTFFAADQTDTEMVLTHNSQGGIRRGSATLFAQWWHPEIQDIIVLKNNAGTEDNRVRKMDYGIQINGFLYERFLQNKTISLFSPHLVPDLLDAFFIDQHEFKRLYELYEADITIPRTTIQAADLIKSICTERFETGRIYIQHIDHCNTHSSFDELVAAIRQSNLCVEITIPTKPLQSLDDIAGEIALCILTAHNLGNLKKLEDFEEWADITVRALDELIDLQDYPLQAAEIATRNRRSLGVGVINMAYYLANNGVRYSDGSALPLIHRTMEAMSYYLIKASMELAKEKGPCGYFHETKYSHGILPIDTYKADVDLLVPNDLAYDWDRLRTDILSYGMRNSALMAMMPSETSSQVANATNGFEMPRSLATEKGSKSTNSVQVAPESVRLKHKYDMAWEMTSNTGYLHSCAVIQKFTDQALSTNGYYNPTHYEDGKIPMKVLIGDLLTAYKYGIKTLYYSNTYDNRGDDEDSGGCSGGACAI